VEALREGGREGGKEGGRKGGVSMRDVSVEPTYNLSSTPPSIPPPALNMLFVNPSLPLSLPPSLPPYLDGIVPHGVIFVLTKTITLFRNRTESL